ncbi:Phosphotransferase enzyme family protein [Asanoa hainanensis]|uniref:Phosphotransferase enzyme family protein n=1 Tax=Asanoa hainanensis TaxID=560556 RepID=A0A239JKG5_9ACTN|nr:phosphotransferase [Asanoa hainanensis]SNT06526.1 Phosphotransferase enzyme family protein [Asanoa hainanensis]
MATTHALRFADGLVTKRYTSWGRGEHRREWAVLHRLREHAAGLAPEPVRASLDANPPTVTMKLATAVRTLWSVPFDGDPPVEDWAPDLHFARRLGDADWPDPPAEVGAALAASARWWWGPDPDLLSERPDTLVLGHRDPNLANYLWDGRRVRIVDFEDARVSDPATEIALLAEHVSARQLFADGLPKQFADAVSDRRRLRAARRLWAMFWLSLLRPGGPASRRNPEHLARHQARRLLDLLRD